MLDIQTFDAASGGNVLYKALAHPLAAEAMARLAERLGDAGPVMLFDPDGVASPLLTLYPALPIAGLFVQDVRALGAVRAGLTAQPVTQLAASGARTVLVAAFDAGRTIARLRAWLPEDMTILSLDEARLPAAMLTNTRRYLDPLNFAMNFAFFRDERGLSSRLVTANYWAGYGATNVRFWLRLYDGAGEVMAEWEAPAPRGPGGIAFDSTEIRARFGLGAFTGQLFIHAIGVAGHDIVKYALDTRGSGNDGSLSCTHDANAWPSNRYAGLPAPRDDERVVLWVQNSHGTVIPAGAIALDRMGRGEPVALAEPIGPFASRALDVAELLPGLRWPEQVEVLSGRHIVRPRYEVTRRGRTRIAHVNVERADLRPDPGIATLPDLLGRGFLLPFPILPRRDLRSIVLPTPMAETETALPVRLDIFDAEGVPLGQSFLGCLPRDHAVAVDFDALLDATALQDIGGHAELVYDFRDGGEANGWLHALVRYEMRDGSHAAETSFGAHIFNTLMTYKGEPQSYSGPPPGLTTRLFLKLGEPGRASFAHLIYSTSAQWKPRSETMLTLHDSAGDVVTEESISIAASGSMLVRPDRIFSKAAIEQAGPCGYVLIRDTTCRLFGYHGLVDECGGFSLDHMFGF
ncbi:hypothetical protein [Acidisoma cladoniae]|jgi:hypothetical protein|uniref:hypothetical protein n=1 Tax=Acidisoma cladoniae TaxID=3040935 RepID=UPI00254FA29C|nr:hypothetical protein [Acidisoma sp. PAMC 29798]